VTNDKITASKGTIIENDVYTLELTDEDIDVVKFLVNSGVDVNQLFPLSQVTEKLLHINLTIGNIYELASLSFDDFLMENQSFFYNEATGEYLTFDQIRIDEPIFPFLVPNITEFAPNPITAGTGSELTITGTGFGAVQGIVRFPNADDGGMTMMQADAADIISWNDLEIVVRVPSVRNGVGQQGNPSGSGIFQIETAIGELAENAPPLLPLEIRYAVANFRPIPVGVRPHMADLNGMDGYTFTLGFSLSNTPNARDIVVEAMCDWNKATDINWVLNDATTMVPAADGSDMVNAIFLGNDDNFVGSSADATAFTVITGSTCQDMGGNLFTYISDADIILRENLGTILPGITWHYDEVAAPNILQFDFYSVIKHELGHAHNLKHAIPDTKNAVIDESMAVLGPQALCPSPISRDATVCLELHTHDLDNEQNILLIPNLVVSNKLNIFIDSNLTGEIIIDIWDITGSNVVSYIVDVNETSTNIQLELPKKLEQGSYFLRIAQERNHIAMKKFIKL